MVKKYVWKHISFNYSIKNSLNKSWVLLVHGFIGDLNTWSFLDSALNHNYNVLNVNLPGHGMSDEVTKSYTLNKYSEALKGLLDKYEINSTSVIGHSMGGYVALALLDLYPDSLNKVILINSTAQEDAPNKIKDRDRAVKMLEKKSDLYLREAIRFLFPEKFLEQNTVLFKMVQETAMNTTVSGAIEAQRAMAKRKNLTHLYHEYGNNMMLISGEEDATIPLERNVKEVLGTNVTHHTIKQAGHMLYIEAPDKLKKIIQEFLLTHNGAVDI